MYFCNIFFHKYIDNDIEVNYVIVLQSGILFIWETDKKKLKKIFNAVILSLILSLLLNWSLLRFSQY